MKANTLKTLFVLSSVLVAGLAMAQQAGPGGQGGRQRGGFGAMMSSPVFLVGRADVQRDIKLTDEQKAKLEALKTEFPLLNRGGNRGGGAGGGGNRGGGAGGTGGGGAQGGGQGGQRQGGGQGGGQVDAAAMQEMMKKAEAAVNEILTDEQEIRVKQIGIQLGGAGVFSREDVQKDLALTVDQKKSIMDLQQKQQAANGELMQRVQGQEITMQEMMEIRTKNDKMLLDGIVGLLTQEQKDKYEAMKGAKFVADPPQQRGGSNGGGN